MQRSRLSIRRSRRQRGSALVEGALTLTAFLAIFFGIVEFGRAVFIYDQLSYLAQVGSRYASVRGSTAPTPATTTSIQTYVNSQAIGVSGLTVTTTWQTNQNVPGHWVMVKVSYPLTFFAPFMPGTGMTLASAARDTILQ